MQDESQAGRASLAAIFRVFFMIGATSFGGGVTAWIHHETVTKRGWLTDSQFLSGVALSQVVPGTNVTNISVYLGQLLRGPIGAATALVAVIAPPFFICIGLSSIYDVAIAVPGFHAAMDGIAAAAIGIVLRLGYMGARHGCRRITPILVAVAVFVSIGIMRWPLVPVVLTLAPISVALMWPRRPRDA
jgi:chromate transporter